MSPTADYDILVFWSGDNIYVSDYATPQDAANDAEGKNLVFPANAVYTVTSLSIPANCNVVGNNATLRFPSDSTSSSSHSDEILKVNGNGVLIDNLTLDGNSDNQSGIWSQHRHCIRIHGAFSDCQVRNCRMINIIGDGVYVNSTGSNNKVGPNNSFTSANHNRNGVSVIRGTDIEVYSNIFTECSRDGMPGPIDIEPNASTDVLQNILIHDNIILGGSVSGAGTLPGIVYSGFQNAAGNNIQIYNNDVSGTRFTCGILAIGINGGPFNAATGIDIYSNSIHDIGSSAKIGIELDYWIGADVYGNTLNGMQYGIYNFQACLGTTTPTNTFTDVTTNITNDTPHCS